MNSVRSNNKFEISKICDIGFQRYRDFKFIVCGKDSIPLELKGLCKRNIKLPSIYRMTMSDSQQYPSKLVN